MFRAGHHFSESLTVFDKISLWTSWMALGRTPQLYYNTGCCKNTGLVPSRDIQPQLGLLPQSCFWGLHLPGILFPSQYITTTEPIHQCPSSVQPGVLGWAGLGCTAMVVSFKKLELLVLGHLAGRPILAYCSALPCSHLHICLLLDAPTHSLLCLFL